MDQAEKTSPEAIVALVWAARRPVARVWQFSRFVASLASRLDQASASADNLGAALVFLKEAPLRSMR